jgi:4-hydroxy-tetrahydrodipicolinate reductase
LLADALNLPLDDIRLTQEKAVSDRRLQIASGTVEAGTVAARRTEYVGIVDGEPRIFYELVWRVTNEIKPEWPSGDAHYDVVIEGDPCLRCRLDISVGQGRHISMVTAMHAVNAIPYVCEAEPGVKTFLDLPLMGGGVLAE